MKIFDLPGPEFLSLYCWLLMAALVLAWVLPHLFRWPFDAPLLAGDDLDAFEIAFLAGGPKGVIHTALVALCKRGLIRPDRLQYGFRRTSLPAGTLTPIEAVLYNRITPTAVPSSAL